MTTCYRLDQFALPASSHVPRASWTAIIPAASEPKLLERVEGKSLLEGCIERVDLFCHHVIFVLAPGLEPLVRPYGEEMLPGRFKLLTQKEPLGMERDVYRCQAAVKTPRVLVLDPRSEPLSDAAMMACMMLSKQNPDAALILPTAWRENPSVYSDCGVFFFKSAALFRGLGEAGVSAVRGFPTRGSKLLPVIPHLDKHPGDVITLRIN